jgi:hypothetical protein
MNDLQGALPGATQLLLESLYYNAGLGWQKQVTLWVPVVVMIFLFTELISKSEAKRKGNVICLIQVALGCFIALFTLAQVNGRLFQEANAMMAVGGSIIALLLIGAIILTPLAMLISGAGYVEGLRAWVITLLAAMGVVMATNIVWQLMKKSDIRVLTMEGSVKHRGSPVQWWSNLSGTNAALPVGTVFKTGPGESVILRLGPTTVVSLRPESEMAVRLSKGLPVVELGHGKLIGDVVPGQNERFIIRTPAGYAGILGTRFMVEVGADKTTTTTVLEGFVRVAGKVAGSSEETVESGKSALIKPGNAPETPMPAASDDLDELVKVFSQRVGAQR